MKRKGLFKLVGAICLAAVIAIPFAAGCAAPAPAPAPTPTTGPSRVLVVAHGETVIDTPYHQWLSKFSEVLAVKTQSRITIEEHMAGELGAERETIEAVQMGTLDMTIVATPPVGGFSPALRWSTLYCVIRDADHARKVFADEKVKATLMELAPSGFIGLSYLEQGPRQTYTAKKEINSLADLKGLTMRVMEDPVCIAGWKAFGTVPTPLPFTEVFTALETGVIDGGEHPIWAYLSSREYELAPYFAATNHQWGISVVLLSKKTWDSLSAADQEIIMEAADAARDYASDKLAETVARTTETLTAAGVTFTYPDLQEFIDAATPAMAPFEEEIGKDFVAYIRSL